MVISFLSTCVISFLTNRLAIFLHVAVVFRCLLYSFVSIFILNRKLHGRLAMEIHVRNFSSHLEKYLTRALRSLVKYFSTLKDKFCISARPCNILYFTKTTTVTVKPVFSGHPWDPRYCPLKVILLNLH